MLGELAGREMMSGISTVQPLVSGLCRGGPNELLWDPAGQQSAPGQHKRQCQGWPGGRQKASERKSLTSCWSYLAGAEE